MTLSLQKVEQAIEEFEPEQQQQLLVELPSLLKISSSDFSFLKLSEDSFSFWDNPDDAIYDNL